MTQATRHPAHATLDAWRASGAHRLDPLRFDLLEALARRAVQHSGDARRVLDDRVSALLSEYAARVERAEADADADATSAVVQPCAAPDVPDAPVVADAADAANEPDHATLAALIARLGQHHARADAPHAGAYPELPALDHFREVWSKVRTEKQLRQSLAPVPGNAGPLNSSSLVHRALSLMRELSPGYLKQFLSYVDTLSWLEQMNGGAPAEKEAPRAAAASKSTRRKAR
ncbi:DUF2894 domain-containing protein [Paraburkholderia antibiotica]|uniref:DUF2894 domain-containing protein n=1 Tax=Paraburkholderia antibiotica TaxID=2728839 RepID=UPI002E30D3DE|nr:DUF2894 domain-containing protein [Paraburkholderia antibiotica]